MGLNVVRLLEAVSRRIDEADIRLWRKLDRCVSEVFAFVVVQALRDMGFEIEGVEPGVIVKLKGDAPLFVKYVGRLTVRRLGVIRAGKQIVSDGGLMVLLVEEGTDLLNRFGEVYIRSIGEYKLCVVGVDMGLSEITRVPGLLVFDGRQVSSADILAAVSREGADLTQLMKKRDDAIRVLGQRGVGVVSNSDIAYHRLRLADLSGGFADFMQEIDRLKQDGIWDDGVKELVRSMLRKYISLGVPQQVVEEEAKRRGIDIYA